MDVRVNEECDGLVSYLHKVKEGRDIYYFINCNSKQVVLDISLQNEMELEVLNPHDGMRQKLENVFGKNGQMRLQLTLEANRSLVLKG